MPAARSLRVGLAGCGMISQFHLRAWSKLSNASVVALCDVNVERAALRAREFDIGSTYADPAEMLAREYLDALDIATPTDTHAELVDLAGRQGVPVLCQKPLAATLDGAERMVAGARQRIRLMAHENWRFRPYYRQIGAWLREGRIGSLVQGFVHARSSGLLVDADGTQPALQREPGLAALERFVLGSVLTHHVDVARWLFPGPRVVAARKTRSIEAVIGETAATIVLECNDHALLVVDGNLAAPGATSGLSDRLELIGTVGAIAFDGECLTLVADEKIAIHYDLAVAYQQGFDAAIAHFVEALGVGTPFETDAADNLETLALIEQAYRLCEER
jgi:D-apiose dehydrogenase